MTSIAKYLRQKTVLEQLIKRMDMLAAEHAALSQRQGEIERELEDLSQKISPHLAFTESQAPIFSTINETKGEFLAQPTESLETGAGRTESLSRQALVTRMSGERRSVSEAVREFEVAAYKVLSTSNRPLNRNEMYSKVLDMGLLLPGDTERDQINALGARMSRMPGVENIKTSTQRGYWLAERKHELEEQSSDASSMRARTASLL